MRLLVAIFCALLTTVLWARPAACAIERFALLVGNDRGSEDDAPLRYAETDADRLARVLQDVGGFAPANVTVLRGESADTVQRTLIALNDRIRTSVTTPGTQVVLFVYYSGHADARALHLGATRLDLAVLEQLVRSSAAAFRVLVVDACRSGALTRVKGGRPMPAIALHVDQPLSGEGVVFLTSSSANEDAQESDEIQGSFFTHYFRSGLLGAADEDGDGRVTLDEAYRHAHEGTLRASSRTWAGLQHPTFRYELRGQGRLVLSELPRDAAHAALSFPAGRDYLLMSGDAQGPVVAEVSRYARGRTLSVRPGHYFVRGRASDHLLEGPLSVEARASLTVTDDRLARVQYARLARKGNGEAPLAHGPLAGYTFRTALPNSSAPCHGAFVAYPLALPLLTLSPRLSACHSGFENNYLEADANEYALELELSHAWDLPLVSLSAAIAPGSALLEQTFDTEGRARPRRNLAATLAATAAAQLQLIDSVYLSLDAGAQSYAFRLTRDADRGATWEASLALRARAGVGWYW